MNILQKSIAYKVLEWCIDNICDRLFVNFQTVRPLTYKEIHKGMSFSKMTYNKFGQYSEIFDIYIIDISPYGKGKTEIMISCRDQKGNYIETTIDWSVPYWLFYP